MRAPHVGLTLQPDPEYLELLGSVLRDDADYYEVAPETTWRLDGRGRLVENAYHHLFAELGRATGKPFVAHGVGLSLGTIDPSDAPRRRRWLRRIALDHRVFRYRWYTDHLGMTSVAGHAITLPVATPHTERRASAVRRRLRAMQHVVPDVGFETTAQHFVLGHALDEPRFIARALDAPRTHLVLDLHNVVAMSENLGFDPRAYLEGLFAHGLGPRVIEIHVSGGTPSDPRWLASSRVLRLDSHDASVPELVWALLAEALPRCPHIRGVTLERMEGSVTSDADVAAIRDELHHARSVIAQSSRETPGFSLARRNLPRRRRRPLARLSARSDALIEPLLARLLLAPDAVVEIDRVRADRDTPDDVRALLDAVDPDGLAMSALLVARMRFERVTNGSARALSDFDDDAESFARTFRRYHLEVPPHAFSVQAEGRAYVAWLGRA